MEITIDLNKRAVENLWSAACRNLYPKQRERFELDEGNPDEFPPEGIMCWHRSFLDMMFFQAFLVTQGFKVCTLWDLQAEGDQIDDPWVTLTNKEYPDTEDSVYVKEKNVHYIPPRGLFS
jgi:hypothetical protein